MVELKTQIKHENALTECYTLHVLCKLQTEYVVCVKHKQFIVERYQNYMIVPDDKERKLRKGDSCGFGILCHIFNNL